MIELITKNVIIGTTIILINLIPLILRKYKYIQLTALISLVLMLLGIYIK